MASKSGKMTPMMTQYTAMRRSLPDDVILFFRLGDFYEMFFEDAQRAAPIMNVALTKRGGTPMCGVPFHAAEGYIGKLVKAGVRVAIAEQTSVPQPGKIVEREISQIISAGTIADLNLLEDDRPKLPRCHLDHQQNWSNDYLHEFRSYHPYRCNQRRIGSDFRKILVPAGQQNWGR